jgi:tRNA 5-methylaminomethyl-2-thiouridine biosynthesis bifunctional protein
MIDPESATAPGPATSPILWDADGPPRSALYDDLYYSRDDGLAESRAVFLAGCGLPDAWAGRKHFTVGELGFGTGLNIAALLELWSRTRPTGARLSIFSIEGHPISADDAGRALGAWPELSGVAGALTSRWPGRAKGFHRLEIEDLGVTIDVAIMEAADALADWSGQADAWLLDGFAPAINPAMWSIPVLGAVAARSAPGARLATYTVAGEVRRSLAAAGFAVDRRPGFGRKRERLEARWPGTAAPDGRPRVAIVGAGIGGAALARAFRALGVEARVFDADRAGAGASGGRAALVAPRLDAGLGPQAALFAQALRRAGTLYEAIPDAVIGCGAVQLVTGPKDPGRFATIAGSDLFEPHSMRRIDAVALFDLAGGATPEGLQIDNARVVDPAVILNAWMESVKHAAVRRIVNADGVWRLFDKDEGLITEADCVCVAAGMETSNLVTGVPLLPVRGQASLAAGISWPIATLFGGYAIPARGGVVFGATHDRGDTDACPRDADHDRNRQTVGAALPGLAAKLEGVQVSAHTGIRATTADYLPIAGAAPEAAAGLFVLTGLGSRGYTLAPLLAEHIAAQATGAPSPLPATLAALVDPGRFAARARRRGLA